jgi:hypothetical protein
VKTDARSNELTSSLIRKVHIRRYPIEEPIRMYYPVYNVPENGSFTASGMLIRWNTVLLNKPLRCCALLTAFSKRSSKSLLDNSTPSESVSSESVCEHIVHKEASSTS